MRLLFTILAATLALAAPAEAFDPIVEAQNYATTPTA
jgi:hypothetical protein